MLIKPGNKQPTIKVIGIGGFGARNIKEMVASNIFNGVEFVTITPGKDRSLPVGTLTDITLIHKAGSASPQDESYEKWREIALNNKEIIEDCVTDTDIAFLACNMGRGFSTGVAPVVAEIARAQGALVIAVVAMPFAMEGKQRRLVADKGLRLLKQTAGTTIVVNKQRLFENIVSGTKVIKAFEQIKAPLHHSIEILSRIIRVAGLINIDLADLKLIMDNKSLGFIGEGVGTGDITKRAQQAVSQALSFPLTDNSIKKAGNVLFNITGNKYMGMSEIDDIAKMITETVQSDANIKFGVTIDENMGEQIKVTIMATSMNDSVPLKHTHYSNELTNLNIPTFMRRDSVEMHN